MAFSKIQDPNAALQVNGLAQEASACINHTQELQEKTRVSSSLLKSKLCKNSDSGFHCVNDKHIMLHEISKTDHWNYKNAELKLTRHLGNVFKNLKGAMGHKNLKLLALIFNNIYIF